MKDFLQKKWLGPVIVLLWTVAASLVFSYQVTPVLHKLLSIVTEEAGTFLPITYQNGEVVQPANTIISKTYPLGNDKTFNVVLDTRTDTLDINELPGVGYYVSKKCIYAVTSQKREVSCFGLNQKSESFVLTQEDVKTFVAWMDKFGVTLLNIIFIVTIFTIFYLIALFYTVIMHWAIALFFKTTFGQTFFVNTLFLVGREFLETITSARLGFWLTLFLLAVANVMICKSTNERKS